MKQADLSAPAGSKAEAASLFAAPMRAAPSPAGRAGRIAAICLSIFALAFIVRLTVFFGAAAQVAAAPVGAVAGLMAGLILAAGALMAAAAALWFLYQRLIRAKAGQAQLKREIAALQQELNSRPGAKAAMPAKPAAAPAAATAELEALLNAAPMPLWLRQADGKLIFVNKAGKSLLHAYLASARAKARQAGKTETAAENEGEDLNILLPEAARRARAAARANHDNLSLRFNLALKGERRIFIYRSFYRAEQNCFLDILDDITEKTTFKQDAARIKQGYAETFDRLSTSVAIFDPEQKLEFFNTAFANLWPLETQFLESRPSHALLLDRLREKGILNERPDWRQWEEELFEAYHSPEPQHYTWDLPDGRTLQVVANPHPQGGVTWLFDDRTEILALQARYNSLIHRQGETLDSLSEGVAVFGADGRLRLSNPAFGQLWHLPGDLALEGTHIEKIKAFCQGANPFAATPAGKNSRTEQAASVWTKIALFITGFADKRDTGSGRAVLADKSVYDYRLVPLPQGETMLTFVNITDSVNIARALHERNAALESADRLRNDFIQHVSYELRTPLTNIIGFAQLLGEGDYGSLNPRQSECLSDITAQSNLLLNLVNDILDLATVDAGIMELNIHPVAIAAVMEQACTRLHDRLAEKHLRTELKIAPGLTGFEADEGRLRQIFVNLLSNAITASPEHSLIRFYAQKQGNYLAFSVEDAGKGIPKERRPDIFKRFTSYAYEGQNTGAGLGLSIVKSFVELHQGHVEVEDSAEGGTKFICRFPFRAADKTAKTAAKAITDQAGA